MATGPEVLGGLSSDAFRKQEVPLVDAGKAGQQPHSRNQSGPRRRRRHSSGHRAPPLGDKEPTAPDVRGGVLPVTVKAGGRQTQVLFAGPGPARCPGPFRPEPMRKGTGVATLLLRRTTRRTTSSRGVWGRHQEAIRARAAGPLLPPRRGAPGGLSPGRNSRGVAPVAPAHGRMERARALLGRDGSLLPDAPHHVDVRRYPRAGLGPELNHQQVPRGMEQAGQVRAGRRGRPGETAAS